MERKGISAGIVVVTVAAEVGKGVCNVGFAVAPGMLVGVFVDGAIVLGIEVGRTVGFPEVGTRVGAERLGKLLDILGIGVAIGAMLGTIVGDIVG